MYYIERKYYINGKETTLDIILKYLEIMLQYNDKQLREINVSFIDHKIEC